MTWGIEERIRAVHIMNGLPATVSDFLNQGSWLESYVQNWPFPQGLIVRIFRDPDGPGSIAMHHLKAIYLPHLNTAIEMANASNLDALKLEVLVAALDQRPSTLIEDYPILKIALQEFRHKVRCVRDEAETMPPAQHSMQFMMIIGDALNRPSDVVQNSVRLARWRHLLDLHDAWPRQALKQINSVMDKIWIYLDLAVRMCAVDEERAQWFEKSTKDQRQSRLMGKVKRAIPGVTGRRRSSAVDLGDADARKTTTHGKWAGLRHNMLHAVLGELDQEEETKDDEQMTIGLRTALERHEARQIDLWNEWQRVFSHQPKKVVPQWSCAMLKHIATRTVDEWNDLKCFFPRDAPWPCLEDGSFPARIACPFPTCSMTLSLQGPSVRIAESKLRRHVLTECQRTVGTCRECTLGVSIATFKRHKVVLHK